MIQVSDFAQSLELTCLIRGSKSEWDMVNADINRPGMQLCGYYQYFPYERPQVFGKVELSYLNQLTPEARTETLKKYFSWPLPCVIVCRGMTPPDELLALARENDVYVFHTSLVTTLLCSNVIRYLNQRLAPHIIRHGVLLDVYGVGVLLTGKSGVGKSEAALELIKRGHQLVADDVVDICRDSPSRVIGSCPEKVRHYMEIRGIGLIDIRAMYGISAVSDSRSIDIVIQMEAWEEGRQYDRLGLEETTIDILDVRVPYRVIPVMPGRNLAIVIEVAARNHSLKQAGYNAAQALLRHVNEDSDQTEY